jgi:hypothetical protein
MTARPDIVNVLIHSDPRTVLPRAGRPYQPLRRDGSPLSPEEIDLVMAAGIDELEAADRHFRAEVDRATEQHELGRRVQELVAPYFGQLPPGATLEDVRGLMPEDERRELDRLAGALTF